MLILIDTLIIIAMCAGIFFYGRWVWLLSIARRKGLYPEAGKGTMFDVRRLIIQGEKELAVRLYAEIFRTNNKEAQKAVEDLERSILQKNSGN